MTIGSKTFDLMTFVQKTFALKSRVLRLNMVVKHQIAARLESQFKHTSIIIIVLEQVN
jgi:hypothetical protein